jgi:hypothetical protein
MSAPTISDGAPGRPIPPRRNAMHRNAPVVCLRCGRSVPRQARQQLYCSDACRERGRERTRVGAIKKGARYLPTSAPANPQKKVNGFNLLSAPKSGSSLGSGAPRWVIEVEVFGGRAWRQVVSSGGVVCEVGTLRKRALRDGGAS